MDDDEFDVNEQERGLFEPLNWADVVYSLVCIPYFTVKGLMVCFENIADGLKWTSRSIDARRQFAREVGAGIESMTRGDM
jgi:hypothetical protein